MSEKKKTPEVAGALNEYINNNYNSSKIYLDEVHIIELESSGIDIETAHKLGIRTISIEEANKLGFKVFLEGTNLLDEAYIKNCLFYPYRDINNEDCYEAWDPLGVIKPNYTEQAKQKFNKDLAKYICLPKDLQSKNLAYFGCLNVGPKSNKEHKQLFLTEGFKKAIAACLRGYPCVALWSIWCFCESGTDSPMINTLVEYIKKNNPEIYIVFDSDKTYKDGVAKAEQALIDKIFLETGQIAKSITLPHLVGTEPTKGLDDYLAQASNDDFDTLIKNASIPFSSVIQARRVRKIPRLPSKFMPTTLNLLVEDFKAKYEGCHEMAAMGMFASISGCLRNSVSIEGKRANLYMIGIADTVSGKSTVAKKSLEAFNAINNQRIFEYQKDIDIFSENRSEENLDSQMNQAKLVEISDDKADDSNNDYIGSNQIGITQFTEQGLLELLLRILRVPACLYFETEEFDIFLRKYNQEYNSSLSSFITKAFDADELQEPIVKDNIRNNKKLGCVFNPALSIAGVLTGAAYEDTKPKSAEHTGYDNRFVKFFGSPRSKNIPIIEEIDTSLVKKHKKTLRSIEAYSLGYKKKADLVDIKLSTEAQELWSKEYISFKDSLASVEPVMQPYYSRAFQDYSKKIALLFQVYEIAEGFLEDRVQIREITTPFNLLKEPLEATSISLENLERGIAWAKYFMQTANYAYYKFYSSDIFQKKIDLVFDILNEFPHGITLRELSRKTNLHRNSRDKKLLNEIVEYLKDEGKITVQEKGNSKKITKAKHLL